MAISAQHPNTANAVWKVYIKTTSFEDLYNIYYRNFISTNRQIREYSVIWFRQIWKCINELAGIGISFGKGIYEVKNDYNPKNSNYGHILYETKRIYNRNDGKYYNILVIFHFDFNIPYVDNYGGSNINISENKQYNTKNKMKRRIRLTEGMLHRMIKEAINELDWKTYASAAEKQPSEYSRSYGPNGNQYRKEIRKVFNKKLEQLGLSSDKLYNIDYDTKEDLWDDAKKEVLRKERKLPVRQKNFRDAAKNAFDRDFGFEDETGTLKCYDKNGELEPHIKDIYGNFYGEPKYYIVNDSVYSSKDNQYINKWKVKTKTIVPWGDCGLDVDLLSVSPDFDTKEEAEEYAKKHNMQTKYVKPSKELQTAYEKARKEAALFSKSDFYGRRKPSNYEYEKGNGWKLKNDGLDEAISKAIRRVLR